MVASIQVVLRTDSDHRILGQSLYDQVSSYDYLHFVSLLDVDQPIPGLQQDDRAR